MTSLTPDAFAKLAAELAIRNLVARIFLLADQAPDLDEYLTCFTEDAIWERVGDDGRPPPGAHVGSRLVGVEAIAADRRKIREVGYQGPGTNTWHVNTTLAVRVNDDGTADAESYWLFVESLEQTRVRSIGHYRDRFRLTEGGWKLAHRRFRIGGTKSA